MGERERERADLDSPLVNAYLDSTPPSPSLEDASAQRGIDTLFDRRHEKAAWEPATAPETLGELMDSRHMLPLLLPSDARLLGAVPARSSPPEPRLRNDSAIDPARSSSRASYGTRGALGWKLQSRKMREVEIRTLQWVDGARSTARWYRPLEFDDEDDKAPSSAHSADNLEHSKDFNLTVHLTPLTNSRVVRSRGRQSAGITPVEPEDNEATGQIRISP
jgi:hypothetical protein